MSGPRDLVQLGKLVAARHGWPAAKAFKAYVMDEAHCAALTRCATDLRRLLPPKSVASAPLAAALAVALERCMTAPIHVVAGSLGVDGAGALGTGTDEHVWVMIGPHVVDMALFPAAMASDAPPRLAAHVLRTFGADKALYVDHWRHTAKLGLDYAPRRVLGSDEVTALMGEAYRTIRESAAQS